MSLVRQVAKFAFSAIDRLASPLSGPRVLIYHQVGSNLESQLDVLPSDFEWQMQWLSSNKTVVRLDEAIERWDEPRGDQLVALTFDDGFSDTYSNAFPVLRSMELPFTLFVTTGIVGNDDWEGRGPMLKWPQIVEMMESGLVTLGAHTHTHPDMRFLSSSEVQLEIEASDKAFLRYLDQTPNHFAYPWGYWAADADVAVRSRYECAFLGSVSILGNPRADDHLIHRFPIQRSDRRQWFAPRLEGGLRAEESLRRRLRGYSGP